jgi:CPA2 family monovalent cation:H+ antiporter-2
MRIHWDLFWYNRNPVWSPWERMGVRDTRSFRAGATLVAPGEFSIAIARFAPAAGVAGRFESLAVTYVFLLAISGRSSLGSRIDW